MLFQSLYFPLDHVLKMFQVDPYLFIGDDLQLHVRSNANMKDFESSGDNQMATSFLFEMRSKVELSNTIITDIIAKHLSKIIVKLEETDVKMQLSEPFTPDDAFMFGSRPIVELEPNKSISKESSLSFDEVNYSLKSQEPNWIFLQDLDFKYIILPACVYILQDVNAGSMVEDEATSELSVRFHPRGSSSPSIPQVITIDQLMESVSADRIRHKLETG